MKIAMVSEHANPLAVLGGVDAGGQNVHVGALAAELGGLGAPTVVYTRRDDPRPPRRVELAEGTWVEHVSAGPACFVSKDDMLPYMRALAAGMRTSWERDRPDIVHAHFWMSAMAALEAARPLSIPVVVTFHALGTVKKRHQGAADTSPCARLAVESQVARDADHIIATSTEEVEELLLMGASPERVTVVPCGVDPVLFQPEGLVAARTSGRQRVLCAGRLVERKGTKDVITALRSLPGAELVIAGGPPRHELARDGDARRLMDWAAHEGVADRTVFLGRVAHEELPAWMRSADVVASVPWYEPFGIVPVEAMACGVPVVASAVGGQLDTVVDGGTGVHVPPKDPEALSSALSLLLSDPELGRRLGRAGAQRAQSRYAWHQVAANTMAVYERVIGRYHGEERPVLSLVRHR